MKKHPIIKILMIAFCFAPCVLAERGIKNSPTPLDIDDVRKEIKRHYRKAHPEVQAYIFKTASSFGRSGLWLNEDAFKMLKGEDREEKVTFLAKLLSEGEYGRHLCEGLAEASAIKNEQLLEGLLKVASYYREDKDYDCRPKWMAVAALARQESEEAVPLLINLVDHGNQNTRMWAKAALSRKLKKDFGSDKKAWAEYWEKKSGKKVEDKYLKPSK